jgi:hypothetical protein
LCRRQDDLLGDRAAESPGQEVPVRLGPLGQEVDVVQPPDRYAAARVGLRLVLQRRFQLA